MDFSVPSADDLKPLVGAFSAFVTVCGTLGGLYAAWRRRKSKRALRGLAIAEQLERHAQACASIGDDNAAALRSDDAYPIFTCALPPLPAAALTGDADADRALLPQYRDLVRHVVDVNQHVDQTAVQNNVEDSFRTLEGRADETAVRAWRLADDYRARFGLPAPQLGVRETRIRAAAFERAAA
ncbi:hypothetical protein [Burkholderia ubonensis]|uniref:hypothetical protein n=1 Tax=Burkholderia ubonensis TaxID=101571 RepID=UPI00075C6EFB|nr:hypothetical protein [Burkholderia ubonensis]KVL65428.1 hypothetical protein WJ48_01540 [Burkholderia ubonensis]KVL76340.1 hypothetical protein WJ49_11600 [Burkholderia ubonensis]KVL92085.1 hypothetical protein WJ50_10745 [Burkholderia ubonensis]